MKQKVLTALFITLYLGIGLVSTVHSINFFSISNDSWLAITLAIAFEVGQAAVLFAMLIGSTKKKMPWILMCVLTAVQILGNVFASYKYMMINSTDQIQYFTDSVLFFLKDPDPAVNRVMISYITGAILPIVALCMTSMVVDVGSTKQEVLQIPDTLRFDPIDVNKDVTGATENEQYTFIDSASNQPAENSKERVVYP